MDTPPFPPHYNVALITKHRRYQRHYQRYQHHHYRLNRSARQEEQWSLYVCTHEKERSIATPVCAPSLTLSLTCDRQMAGSLYY